MSITPNEKKALNELQTKLAEKYSLVDFKLYGSKAIGTDVSGSDLDVMIVLDEFSPAVVEKVRATRYKVMQHYQYRPLISLLLLSEEDWVSLSSRSAGLKQNIENEGITLWSRDWI